MLMKTSGIVLAALVLACAAEPADEGGGPSSSGTPGTTGTTGSADTSGANASESGGADGPIDLTCDDPQPILQGDGTPSGFVQCDDGFRHRAEAVACVVPDVGPCDSCSSDCSELPLGRCVENPGEGSCSCVASCETDADCGENQACACLGDVPRCVPATCTTTAECGDGLCGISGSASCELDSSLACLVASSECRSTICEGGTECVCYASSGAYSCHDECFSGCG
jgi:hypothetical protein